jgi:hypothetical protein
MENNDQADPTEGLKIKFANERKEWLVKVKDMASRMYKIELLAEVQVDLLSNRQVIIEYNHELLANMSSLNKIYKEKRKVRFVEYNEKYDIRLQKAEKDIMIDGDLSGLGEKMDLLSDQIKFYDKTMQTIDHALYAMKNRIQLEEFRRK